MFPIFNRILTVDMGSHSCKFIEALPDRELRILNYGTFRTEQLFGRQTPAREWKRLGCNARDTILSFHHRSLIVRKFNLNASNEYQLQKYIKEELQQYQIDLKDEYDFDYAVQPNEAESGTYQTKTMGISRSVNREYINKAIDLGLRPKAVDIQVNAALRVVKKVLERCQSYYQALPCLLLDLGYENTTAGIAVMDGITTLKVIPTGCRMVEESSNNLNEYIRQIISLCDQIIEYYIRTCREGYLQQGILYGGGACHPEVLSCLQEKVPLYWNDLRHYTPYLPEIPRDMDLNLYANCLGSLLWEKHMNREGRKTVI